MKPQIQYESDGEMFVQMPAFVTKDLLEENKKIVKEIMTYCSNQLYYRQLTKAKEIRQDCEERKMGYPQNQNVVYLEEYAPGLSAMLWVSLPFHKSAPTGHEKMSIEPYIQFDGLTAYGLTVTPGSMSDLILYDDGIGGIRGYTKDFSLYQHGMVALFLEMYCDLIEQIILQKKEVPENWEAYTAFDFQSNNPDVRAAKQVIKTVLVKKLTQNQSVRIDRLPNLGVLEKYRIYSPDLQPPTVLINIGLEMGKTPAQVYRFLGKRRKKELE